MDFLTKRDFYRRNLPHYLLSGADYFITCRLAGTLPQPKMRRSFSEWEKQLHHSGLGPKWLANPHVAQLVWDALHYRNGKVFDLHAFCIMPNHLHLVFRHLVGDFPKGPLQNDSLTGIMHSLKRKTALDANKVLQRQGPFWQDESFDRMIRTTSEWQKTIYYTIQNPLKAGLVHH